MIQTKNFMLSICYNYLKNKTVTLQLTNRPNHFNYYTNYKFVKAFSNNNIKAFILSTKNFRL